MLTLFLFHHLLLYPLFSLTQWRRLFLKTRRRQSCSVRRLSQWILSSKVGWRKCTKYYRIPRISDYALKGNIKIQRWSDSNQQQPGTLLLNGDIKKIKTRFHFKEVRIFIVVPCMLFQSPHYCSNSCTSLHFKTLKLHTKTLKIRPYMFRSPLKPSSGGPWPYFATLLNWNVVTRVSVCGCMSVHSVI